MNFISPGQLLVTIFPLAIQMRKAEVNIQDYGWNWLRLRIQCFAARVMVHCSGPELLCANKKCSLFLMYLPEKSVRLMREIYLVV